MAQKRIEYIDAMRGFTMLLVVFSHIVVLCYGRKDLTTFNNVFVNFRMPLFFFISGFVLYKESQIWDRCYLYSFIKKKALVQILPTILFLALYLYINNLNINNAFVHKKMGYWFTLTLFQFFVFYSTFRLIKFNKKREDIYLFFYALFIYTIGILLGKYLILLKPDSITSLIINGFDILEWRYFIFFCFGTLVRKHFQSFAAIIEDNLYITVILIIFFALVLFSGKISIPIWGSISFILYGIIGIIVIFSFFKKHEVLFSSRNKIGLYLQYIGKRTLDIYLLHYFFLPTNLSFIGDFLYKYNNPSLELYISITIAILVVIICLTISNIIRLSPFLAHYLFGVKYK